MISDFKIYVPVLNEEVLIKHTVNALLTVFPDNVEVIDLGCTDSTIEQIKGDVVINNNPIPKDGSAGKYYTALKNEYSKKQPWVLWVDGDEIYPKRTLLKVKDIVERKLSYSNRVYWRVMKEDKGRFFFSKEFLSAGPKLFNSNYQSFRKDWPKEVTVHVNSNYKPAPKSDFNDLWFWHGVLLNRSYQKEATARYKKRLTKQDRYNEVMTWIQFDKLPWEVNFETEPTKDWKVFDMNPWVKASDSEFWTGRL